MQYEIVNLQERAIVGLTARTNNASPDMGDVIGGLWSRFYQDGIYQTIQNKRNDKTMGVYTDYAGNERDDYSIVVGCEVDDAADIPDGAIVKTIPAGQYAKFVVQGHMQKAVHEFWQKLWTMDLPRSYVCDFEEYQNADAENALIHIYIGLKTVESRCGLLCNECEYREKMHCKGCINITKPFWGDCCPVKKCCEDKLLKHCGECTDFPCSLLNSFSYHEEQGDDGRRIEQCRVWGKSQK